MNLVLMMKRLLLLLLLCLPLCGMAQKQFRFYNYTTENGLPTNTYEFIYQDSYGFTWLASFDGLFRWDGYEFRKYRYNENNPASLSSNIVYTIFEDSRKRLWIGTLGGLNLYDRQTDGFTKCALRNGQNGVPINAILEDKNQQLWLGTSFGLCQYNYDKKQENWHIDGNDVVFCMTVDEDNNIWVGTFATGLKKFSQKANKYLPFANAAALTKQLENTKINSILAVSDHHIWVGTESNGLLVTDKNGQLLQHYNSFSINTGGSSKLVRCIYEDTQHSVWIGITRGMLHRMSPNDVKPVPVDIFTQNRENEKMMSISSVREDRFGNTWFTSQENGLFYTNTYKNEFKYFPKLPEQDGVAQTATINCFFENSDGNIWLGTNGGGILGFNAQNQTFNKLPAALASNDAVNDIKQDGNNIWVATWGNGIKMLDAVTQKVTVYKNNPADTNSLPSNDVKSILPDDTCVWIGTHGNGLAYFSKATMRIVHYRNNATLPFDMEAPTWINHLFKDSKKRLWISTYNGVFVFDGKQLLHYVHNSDSSSIGSNSINRVAEDAAGNIWIVHEEGLDKFVEKTASFIRVSAKLNLPQTMKTIVADNDKLWIGCNDGIVCLNTKTNEIKNYDVNDGLAVNAYQKASFRAKSGAFYFGGAKGFISFNPTELKALEFPSNFNFTDLYIYNERQEPGAKSAILTKVLDFTDTLQLRYDQSFFSLGFASPNFYAPAKTQYGYRLQGLRDEWLDVVGDRKISFTNLPPGEYDLLVRFTNPSGKWQVANKKLHIIILPPWWQTWWFRVLIMIAAIAGVVLIFYMRLAAVKKRNRLLKEEVARQTGELQEMNSSLVEQHDKVKAQKEILEASNDEIGRQANKILQQQLQIVNRNQALAQTVGELEKLNDTKDHFFSILAHDLKNPIAAQAEIAEFLLENLRKMDKQNLETYLQSIKNSSSAVYDLLINLLNWSQTQSKQLLPEPVGCNLFSIVTKNLRLLQAQFNKKNIHVEMQVEPEKYIFSDYNMIDTAVRNILANSCKFTNYNGIVKITSDLKDNHVVLCINDNGIGMREAVLADLFRINKKTMSAGTDGEKGIGLGLVVANEFVTINGGSISVESKPGQGSSFFISMPVKDLPVVIKEPVTANLLAKPLEPDLLDTLPEERLIKIRGKKILIVDDNKEVRDYLHLILSGSFEIFEAENGEKALQQTLETPPEIIITDIMMPGISGLQFCREIKGNPDTSHIPVVILTSQGQENMQVHSYEAGADVYLAKPVKKDLLLQVILNLLQRQEKQSHQLMEQMLDDKPFQPAASMSKTDEEFLKNLVTIIESHISDTNLDARLLCRELAISRTILYDKIKSLTGKTVHEFIKSIRLKKSLKLLLEGRLSISQIAFEVGFSSHSYFDKCFVKQYKMGPKEYVNKRRGM